MLIKLWTVVFSGNFYDHLVKFLFSTSPNENGCFLLANTYNTKNNKVIVITNVIKPSEDSWNKNEEYSLEPTSSYVNECVISADTKKSSLIFVHTHPNVMHPAKFSWIDEKSNARMFANLSQILPDRPLGSLVFSRKGICGVIFDERKIQSVSKIKVVGNRLQTFPGVGFDLKTKKIKEKFDRQVRMMGKKNQTNLEDLKITIVGVGGTGSPLAVQLARMGLKNLKIVDKDTIDPTNISRLYGSTESDVNRPKVEVVKTHIEGFSDCNVDVHEIDISQEKEDISFLLESDVIFSCTDNLTSRSILNEISTQYYIPLIDVGCRIHLNNSSITQAIVKVQLVTPDNACLWCSGTLDGKIIMQESLSKSEKKELAKEGYYENIEKQPSIISMTTMAASMAANKLLNLLGIFGENYNSRTQIEIKDGFLIDDTPEIKSNCVCRKKLGMAEKYRSK